MLPHFGLVLVCILSVVSLGAGQQQTCTDTASGNNVCTGRSCVTTASRVIANLNESVDPCQNFYQFACGNWYKSNPPERHNEDEGTWDVFSAQREDTNTRLKELLKKNSEDLEDIRNYISASEANRKLKIFYDSCTDVSTMLAAGKEPLSEFLQSLGGFQLSPKADFTNMDLTELVKNSLLYDSPLMFDITVAVNVSDNTKQAIIITQAPDILKVELTPARFRVSTNSEYVDTVQTMYGLLSRYGLDSITDQTTAHDNGSGEVSDADQMGGNRITSTDHDGADQRLFQAAKEITDFLLDLQLLKNSTKVSKYASQATIGQLQTWVPMIDWTRLFTGLGVPGPITSDYLVYLPHSDYFGRLGRYLGFVSSNIIYNSHIWRIARKYQGFVSVFDPTIYANERQYLLVLEVLKEDRCLILSKLLFPAALGALYIRNEEPAQTKEQVEEMVEYIREEFVNTLMTASWLSNITREEALTKATSMVQHVSHPDFLFDDDILNDMVANKTVNRVEYLKNVVSLYRVSRESMYQSKNDFIDRDEWHITLFPDPFTVNAGYMYSLNSMVVVHAILNGPYFHPNIPRYMNFGAIGFLLGHEFTHGFDYGGARYDARGNKQPWMSEDSGNSFLSNALCYASQYSEMSVRFQGSGITFQIDGFQTLAENIADNGGIKLAYNAYKDLLFNTGVIAEPGLPGLNYSPEQLFFISTSQTWCGRYQDLTTLITHIRSDSHTPNEPRVNGMMMNSEAFSEAFDCPVGSQMNPTQKCNLW